MIGRSIYVVKKTFTSAMTEMIMMYYIQALLCQCFVGLSHTPLETENWEDLVLIVTWETMLLFSNYHYAPMMSCINQEQKCGWPRMGDCYNHMSHITTCHNMAAKTRKHYCVNNDQLSKHLVF